MSQFNALRQLRVEKKLLQYLIDGLRNTFSWKVLGDDSSRKLSTLKFIFRSFQSHVERLMKLEERDGYMDIVLERQPQLTRSVQDLRREHDEVRLEIRAIVNGLERVSPADPLALNGICAQGAALLEKVDNHHTKEADIFQEAFEREEGGEG